MNVFKIINDTYRQCGNPQQLKEYRCKTEEEIQKFINENNGKRMCAISICAFKGSEKIILYVPFDFDCKNKTLTFNEAVRLIDHCKKMKWNYIMVDTTHKGHHVWIECVPKAYGKDVLRNFQEYLTDLLELTTVDEQLFGDVRRLLRIPMTYHEKTGLLCGYVSLKDNGYLVDLDDYMPIKKEIKNVGRMGFRSYGLIKPKTLWDKLNKDELPPCIKENVEVTNPTHWIRYAAVSTLCKMGWSKQKIFDYFKTLNWIDWDMKETRRQIDHIYNNYMPPSRETIAVHIKKNIS